MRRRLVYCMNTFVIAILLCCFGRNTVQAANVSSDGLYSYELNDNNEATHVKLLDESVFVGRFVIPEYIDGHPVVYLDHYFINKDTDIKTIVYPKTFRSYVKEDQQVAFHCCSNPITLEIDAANPYYTSCNGVVFTKDMKTLVRFPNGIQVDTYQVPDGVVTIAEEAFLNNTYLKEVKLPNTVESIGNCAFMSCDSLERLNIPKKVTVIPYYMAAYSSNLSQLELKAGVNRILDNAFIGCTALDNVFLPNTIISIESNAFGCCESLKNITLSKKIRILPSYGFQNTSLTNFLVDEQIKLISIGVFNNCNKMERVIILPFSCNIDNDDSTIYETTKIFSHPGGTAYQYAKKYGRKFESFKVNITRSSINLVGSYTAKLVVSNNTTKQLTWTSSNKKVATVNQNGVVTKVGPGSCMIYAKTVIDGITYKDSCKVKSFVITPAKKTITIPWMKTTKLIMYQMGGRSLTYSSSNKSVATVSKTGAITGKSIGTATITIRTSDRKETAKVKVYVRGVRISLSSLTLPYKGQRYTIGVTNNTGKKLIYTSSNKKVATISSSGKVKAVGMGTCTITVKTSDGIYRDSLKLSVGRIQLKKSTYQLKIGKKLSNVVKQNTTGYKLVYSSSNKKVATVSSNGVIKAKKKGTTYITVKSKKGNIQSKCKIVVK